MRKQATKAKAVPPKPQDRTNATQVKKAALKGCTQNATSQGTKTKTCDAHLLMHATLGRLYITKGTQQSYMTTLLEGGKKTLLIAVTSKMTTHHGAIATQLMMAAAEGDLSKDTLVRMRTEMVKGTA